MNNEYKIGEMIAGKGIFLGEWSPKDNEGKPLSKIFNLFAAPKDLDIVAKYSNAVKEVSCLKHYYGHSGSNFSNDNELYNAIRNDNYNGEWFLPTKEIMHDFLYQNRNIGELKESFSRKPHKTLYEGWYWSCTELVNNSSHVYVIDFENGNKAQSIKELFELSARLVRAVEKAQEPEKLKKPLKLKAPVRF